MIIKMVSNLHFKYLILIVRQWNSGQSLSITVTVEKQIVRFKNKYNRVEIH